MNKLDLCKDGKWGNKLKEISKLVMFVQKRIDFRDLVFLYRIYDGLETNYHVGSFYVNKQNYYLFNKLLEEIKQMYKDEKLYKSYYEFEDDFYYYLYNYMFDQNISKRLYEERICNIVCQITGVTFKDEIIKLDNNISICKGSYLVNKQLTKYLSDVNIIKEGCYLWISNIDLSTSQAEEYLEEYRDKFLNILSFILPYYKETKKNEMFALEDTISCCQGVAFFYYSQIKRLKDLIDTEWNFICDMDEICQSDIFKKLYNLMFIKKDKSEIENRICDVIKWSSYIIDDKLNFLTQVIALERLLTTRSDSDLVNPSITSSIVDAVAFICFDDVNKRIEVAQIIKDFYSIRSKLAHGNISFESSLTIKIYELKELIFECISKLLLDERFKNIKNNEDLYKWIQMKKYENK